jgi:hypothetical protein
LVKLIFFVAGVAVGAAASAVASQPNATFGVTVEVLRTGSASISLGTDRPVLEVGGQRVILEGNGTATATVEY